MRTKQHFLRSLRRHVPVTLSYGFPALLLLVLASRLLLSFTFGEAPVPQLPLTGHVATEERVRLSWRRGDYKGPFTVQVAVNEKFEAPVFSQSTSKTSLLLPKLKRGDRYCWRVQKRENSPVSCFSTSKEVVPY